MRPLRTALAALALAALPSTAMASLSVSVAPSHLVLPGQASTQLTVTNRGDQAGTFEVRVANYTFTADGKVQIDPRLTPGRSAKRWVTVSPERLPLAAGQSGTVTVSSKPPHIATPGDHHALVLLSVLGEGRGEVRVRTQVGVTTMVRVDGPLRRYLQVHRLRVHRAGHMRVLRLGVTNKGNVDERLLRGQVTARIMRGGRTLATLTADARSLLPGTSGVIPLAYHGAIRGKVTIRATLRPMPADQAGPRITTTPPVIRRTISARL